MASLESLPMNRRSKRYITRTTTSQRQLPSATRQVLRRGRVLPGTLLEILFLGLLVSLSFGLIQLVVTASWSASPSSAVLHDPISNMTTICEGKSLFINRGISEIVRLDLEHETWDTLLKINQGTLARSCVADDGQVSIHSVDAQEVMILRKGEWIISERLRHPQEDPSGRIEIGISENGNRAIRVLRGTAVRCWDFSQEVLVDTEFTLDEPAEKIVLDREGNRLFVATQVGSLHTYDIASGELLQSLRGVGLVTAKPIISADGQAILLVHGQSITRYDIAENQISWRVQLAWPHPLYYVALSPDGTRLAVCGTAAPIHIRDFSTGVLLQTLSKAKCFGGLAFSSGSHQIYSADLDGSIRVWSVSDGREVKQIKPS